MWYDNSQLLSHNKILSFAIGPRGDGKTFNAKRWAINDFIKRGNQFVLLRRYDEEIKKVAPAFFDDIYSEFPNAELKTKGREAFINGKLAGYFIPLSVANKYKSVPFPMVNKIIYDEFIIDKGLTARYLPREVENYLEFYSTVARLRENVRGFFIANAISIVNPYFLYFNVKPDLTKRFTVRDHLAIEIIKDNEYTQAVRKTKFGQLIAGTKYGAYNMDNEFLRDSETFIDKKTPDSEFMLAIKYLGQYYGFWVDWQQGLIFVNKQYDPSSYGLYSITKEDHEPNLIYIKALKDHKPIQRIVLAFQTGNIRCQDQPTKNAFFEIISYFVR